MRRWSQLARDHELSDRAFVHERAVQVTAAQAPHPGERLDAVARRLAEGQLLRVELDLIVELQAGRDATFWRLAIAVDAGAGFA